MIQINHFVTPRTVRFAQIGQISPATKEVVLALHGYGELAEVFAGSFLEIASDERVIICPEAPSRFYTSHRKAAVGACWMTREDREFEIMDYVTYLDGLVSDLLEQAPADVTVTVLGFSQGCPTSTRWLGNGVISADRLILWGADHAHDMGDEEWSVMADIPEITLVAGSADPYLTETRLIKAEEDLRDRQCTFITVRYEGGHEITRDELIGLFAS